MLHMCLCVMVELFRVSWEGAADGLKSMDSIDFRDDEVEDTALCCTDVSCHARPACSETIVLMAWCLTNRRGYVMCWSSSGHWSDTGVHRNKRDKKLNDSTTIWLGD